VASGLPYRRLLAMVPVNRYGFCGTRATASDQHGGIEVAHRHAVPPAPGHRSRRTNRGMRLSSVVFPLPVLPITAVVSPGLATRSTSRSTGLLRARVVELDVLQFQLTVADRDMHRVRRRDDAGLGVQHLLDPLGADLGPGHQHEHEGGHHDRDQDLHQVAEESGQLTDLHAAAGDPVYTPNQSTATLETFQHQHHTGGEHHRQQSADAERDVVQILVGPGEPLPLLLVADEGADHSDAGEPGRAALG